MALALAVLVIDWLPALWCGRDAPRWLLGEPDLVRTLANEQVAFEARDASRLHSRAPDRFTGEWALVTHQMTALGLAQLCLAHPEWRPEYAPVATRGALQSFRPEMRDFGTDAWGEDALSVLDGPHGHAYLAYSALAVGMARLIDPGFPLGESQGYEELIGAYERRLLASPSGLIETYPGEAYPTDVAAVAAAIAVHGRVTGADHRAVLDHWATALRLHQLDPATGLVIQRMGASDSLPHDLPRGSGTGLAAYFAGFADRSVARQLAETLVRHETGLLGFGAIREYPEGKGGWGDVDSGPTLFGVSVAATGFTLAPARAFGHKDTFLRLYRTTELFGIRVGKGTRTRFATGGPIGNALLLAFLTSGPELAP